MTNMHAKKKKKDMTAEEIIVSWGIFLICEALKWHWGNIMSECQTLDLLFGTSSDVEGPR